MTGAVKTAPPGGQAVLFAAPHRAMFLLGGALMLVGFALWLLEMLARAGWLPALAWSLPPGWVHALLVLGGVFPMFMFGFLLTAMPRWQGLPDVQRGHWLQAWGLLCAGWLLAVPGVFVPLLLYIGLAAVIGGWLALLAVLGRIAFHRHGGRMHAIPAWLGLLAGWLALCAWALHLLTGEAHWVRVAIQLGVWWFFLPVFFTVCHRMIPFFSSNVIPDYVPVRPRWALFAMLAASLLHGMGAMLGSTLLWLVDLPAALLALWLTLRWRLFASFRVPLLAMLHVGFAWLGVAWLLFAVQGLAAMQGHHILGLAPLHVLAIGYFGSILLGMVSRVTLGHSGRPLHADRLTLMLFGGLQGVLLARVLADVLPGALSSGLMVVAAVGWLSVFGLWSMRYLPLYVRSRVDGKPG